MIQTIVLIQNGKYPFGQMINYKKTIKVEDIHMFSSIEQLRFHKNKMQQIFALKQKNSTSTNNENMNMNIIKLLKIYQSELKLHFIYEYIPYSLHQFLQNKLFGIKNIQKQKANSNILEMNSKLFVKKVYYQLGIILSLIKYIGSIINFLIKTHIKTDLQFDLLGIDQEENLKFYLGPSFQIIEQSDFSLNTQQKQLANSLSNNQIQLATIQKQLQAFYDCRKQEILLRLEKQFQSFKQKDPFVPNFIIQGNKLIFCQNSTSISNDQITSSVDSFTQNSFTDRSQNINNLFFNSQKNKLDQDINIRRTHGDIFGRMKKKQSKEQNYNTSSNKKIQQNFQKLEILREKSKKLNQQVYQQYLSTNNSNNSINYLFPNVNSPQSPCNQNSTHYQSHFFKKVDPKNQQHWRNSQIPKNLRKEKGAKEHSNNGHSQSASNKFKGNFQNNQNNNINNNFNSNHLKNSQKNFTPTSTFSQNPNNSKRSKSTKSHKNSFQFKSPKQKQWFNPNKSFDKNYEDQFNQDKSFHQKKSIRIQLQQSTAGNKQRKNSYKVKILTCQQMQVDGDNVEQFVFNAMNKNFKQNNDDQSKEQDNQQKNMKSNQSNNQQQNYNDNLENYSESQISQKQSQISQRSKNSVHLQFKNLFPSQDFHSNFSSSPVKSSIKQRNRKNSNSKNIFQKYEEQFNNKQQKPSKSQVLQEKIRLAKLKAQNVLNKYMKTKKYTHNSLSNSKLTL